MEGGGGGNAFPKGTLLLQQTEEGPPLPPGASEAPDSSVKGGASKGLRLPPLPLTPKL